MQTIIRRSRESRDAEDKRHVLASAPTGIAAALLPGGLTNHSAYCLPVRKNIPTAQLSAQKFHGRRIAFADIIILDEVSMVEKGRIEQIDNACRDMALTPALKNLPFGGKVVLMCGDWKQLLPIMQGKSIAEQAAASFRTTNLFKRFKQLKLTINQRMTKGSTQNKFYFKIKF